jgi:hypothetical protein
MTIKQTTSNDSSEIEINNELLHAVVKMNTLLLAAVFSIVGGLGMFVITYMSLLRGLPQPGHYLNVLGVFLPGYSVSHAGAWVGLFWGAIICGGLAAVFYRVYARNIPELVKEYVNSGAVNKGFFSAKLELGGHSLGLALGVVLSAGLIVTTNWLVFRGTADESVNAQLLVNYLPGYSVSTLGSLIGAVELFVMAYLLSRLFSLIYNGVVSIRSKD